MQDVCGDQIRMTGSVREMDKYYWQEKTIWEDISVNNKIKIKFLMVALIKDSNKEDCSHVMISISVWQAVCQNHKLWSTTASKPNPLYLSWPWNWPFHAVRQFFSVPLWYQGIPSFQQVYEPVDGDQQYSLHVTLLSSWGKGKIFTTYHTPCQLQ